MSTNATTQNTLVPYWTLTTESQPEVGSVNLVKAKEEVAFTPDTRTKVATADFGRNGKYYGIVKLFMQYENQGVGSSTWAIGTGWMISDDVLVTAGHCVYNWAEGLGRARMIKAYVGYARKRVFDQFSVGEVVVTTAGWLSGGKNKTKDVAFVKLKTAFKYFTSERLFTYDSTPLTGDDEDLFIVGYPADKTWADPTTKATESGAEMYESSGKVSWNLAETEYMLSYRLSTAEGNSGSPVLRSNRTSSIATHVRGSSLVNSGTSIGTYGNWYPPHIEVINNIAKYKDKVVKEYHSGDDVIIKYVNVPCEGKTESVLKAISSVNNIGKKIIPGVLQLGLPFLGPVGGPLAALAGTVLGWAGSLCETNLGPRDGFSAKMTEKNYAERAILAEAAIQTVGKLNTTQLGDLDLLDKISDHYRVLKPNVGIISPHLLRILQPHGTRIALDAILVKDSIAKQQTTESGSSDGRVEISASNGDQTENEGPIDSDTEAFMAKLLTPTFKCSGEESFIDVLGSVISQGLKLALPIMQTAASGLAALSNTTSTEAAMAPSEADKDVLHLAKRAVVSEAVLQGLMNVDMATLEGIKLSYKDDSGTLQEEAFFDTFKKMAQKIGRQVLRSAPKVIKLATPIIQDLLKGGQQQPVDLSGGAGGGMSGDNTNREQRRKGKKFGKGNEEIKGFGGKEELAAKEEEGEAKEATHEAVENHILALLDLKPGIKHPHLNMPLEDVMREVAESADTNLDGTPFINQHAI